jgi:streptogramin lyase
MATGRPPLPAGPEGALWFTENYGGNGDVPNKIGRITTAGVVTEFPIPTPNSGPEGITSGPDGALWFTEYQANQIGRITTAGAFTEYPTPTASSQPAEITRGPNGGLWFTEFTANKIGTFATANLSVTEAGNGTGQVTSTPAGIACGRSSNQCAAPFIAGTPVTLTASANAGSSFSGWSGGGCSGTAPCMLTLNADATVTASFARFPASCCRSCRPATPPAR